MYTTFMYDQSNGTMTIYLDAVLVGQVTLNLSFPTWSNENDTPLSAIGLNVVTQSDSFYGLMDQLSVSYFIKSISEIEFEATTMTYYKFDTDNFTRGNGPNSIPARSQHVYRSVSNNESTLLFNTTDSYFQASGFTLLQSRGYQFSITLWLRLSLAQADREGQTTAVLQFTSLITGLSTTSYTCALSLHISPQSHMLGVFLPKYFDIFELNKSRIPDNEWTHVGLVYDGQNLFSFYQDGRLIGTEESNRYWSFISDNPRLSLTVGGAYLNDTMPNKPDNFEQMKCFARIPIFNYTQMSGDIDELRVFGRMLSASEMAAYASTKSFV